MNLHATVIKELGGRTYLAGALQLPVETVKSWPKRGIPARYWHRVVELAAAKLPDLTIAQLASERPRVAEAEAERVAA